MPTIPVYLSKDLHKKLRMKLYQNDKTLKEFFLTAAQNYVNPGDEEKIKDEEPENPDSPIKEHSVTDPIEPEGEDKKPKEKIDGEKRQKTGGDKPGGEGKNPEEEAPSVPGEKGGAGPAEPGSRRKRGLWPWLR